MIIQYGRNSPILAIVKNCRHQITAAKIPSSSNFLPSSNATALIAIQFARPLSTKEIFFRPVSESLASKVPDSPFTPAPPTPLADLVSEGKSVLEELDLWAPWKPSSWLRWGLELVHYYTDLPWVGTIAVFTLILRISLIFVPIQMQKFSAKQRQYSPELKEYARRIQEARAEDDNLLVQQIMYENMDFVKQRGLSPAKTMPLMACNVTMFMSQFFAVRTMANSKYPGFQDEGMLWFKDLSVGDPYWALPLITATTIYYVFKTGLEIGNTDALSPIVRTALTYGTPVFVFVFSSQMPTALCIYWITNNLFTMCFSRFSKSKTGIRLMNLPEPPPADPNKQNDFVAAWKAWETRQANKHRSAAVRREEDAETFKKAGRGRPAYLVGENKEQMAAKKGS